MLQNVKMSEFQLLLFLSYFENNRRGGVGLKLPSSPPPSFRLGLIRQFLAMHFK